MNQKNENFNLDIIIKELNKKKENSDEPFDKDIFETTLHYLEELKKYVNTVWVYKVNNNDLDPEIWWTVICDDFLEIGELAVYMSDNNVNIKKGQYVKVIGRRIEEITTERLKDYSKIAKIQKSNN